jgi:isopenicillin N synthase-like dioxygenase
MQTIPVVDLNDFKSADKQRQDLFVKTLGDALVEVGFFAVENHGVSSDLIAKAYQDAKSFFNLPLSAKQNYERRELKGQRGYTGFGKEHAKDSVAPDLKEFWHVGRNLNSDHPRVDEYPKNLWPSEISSFQTTFNSLYSQLDATATILLQAAARYLKLDDKLFSDMSFEGNSILRVIHYPPVPSDRHPASIRAAAHEDINLITLLCESTASGLELLQRDGTWRPIHSLKGQIIADAGDMLQNITNGLFKSTTHRVVNPDNSREERFSMPFFTHPRSECNLSPLKSCIEQTPDHQKKYPNITAGEYLSQRLKEIGLA